VVGERVGAAVDDVGHVLHVTGHVAEISAPYVASAQYAARSVHVAGAPPTVKPVSVESTHAPAGATGAGVAGATGAGVAGATGAAVGDRVAGPETGALVGEATTGAGVAHDALAQMPVKRVIGAWPPERHLSVLS
jgi:hypothetical protein